MKRVFLSHAREPRELLSALRHYLSEGGFSVVDAAHPGRRDVGTSITEALRQADVVIAVLAESNANVLYELGVATGLGKPVVVIGDPEGTPASLDSVPFVRRTHDTRSTAVETLKVIRAMTDRPAVARGGRLSSAEIDAMGWEEFERLVLEEFERLGFLTSRSHERDRYDFMLTSRGSSTRWAVEAKKLARQGLVSVMNVRQLIDVVDAIGANGGIFVASFGFTRSAEDLAMNAGVPLALLTVDRLMSLSSKAEIEAMLRR